MSRRFFEALRNARLSQLKELCHADPEVLNHTTEDGETALIESLKVSDDRKRWKMFKFLLKYGVSPYKRDRKYNRDALHWAIYLAREHEALFLLSDRLNEFDTAHHDNVNMTSLHYAVQNRLTSVVEEICQQNRRYNATVDIKNNLGLTPYLLAVKLGYSELASVLVENGASQYQGHSCRCLRMFEESAERERQRVRKEQKLQEKLHLKIQGRLPLLCNQMKRNDGLMRQSNQDQSLNSVILTNRSDYRGSEYFNEGPHQLEALPRVEVAMSESTGINKLLSLKEDGTYCERYVRSIASDPNQEDEQNKPLPNSMHDINAMFLAVSENMTKAYCSGAKKPDPVKSKEMFPSPVTKTSTLAVIRGNPQPKAPRRRKTKHAHV